MLRILIAEDDPDIQELLQAYLSEEGYDTIPAMDGEQALERFHGSQINLVLLDAMMPRLDGYGVCRTIRTESGVPIIMLTALDSEAHQLRGFDLRIDDYVTKPFSVPVLLRKVVVGAGQYVRPIRRGGPLVRRGAGLLHHLPHRKGVLRGGDRPAGVRGALAG